MDDRRLGLVIRALRRRHGWRQQDLATYSGLSQSAISRVEAGHIDADQILDPVETFLTGHRPIHAGNRMLATILFVDIVDSTLKAIAFGDRKWAAALSSFHGAAAEQVERHSGRHINTTGDGLVATFDGPARAVRCACAISDRVRALGLEIRAGLHTGECELIGDKPGGIAVHTGARVAAQAAGGEVLVSSTVRDLVAGAGLSFQDRGFQLLKGIPGEWRLFAVEH